MIEPTEKDKAKYSDPESVTLRIPVYDGKYTFLKLKDDWRVHVLRHNEPWLVIWEGHNAVSMLMYELEEALEKLEKKNAAY